MKARALTVAEGRALIQARKGKAQRSKYSVRTDAAGKLQRTVDGILFASQAEARRYGKLKLLEKAGEIADLVCQQRFTLEVQPPDDDEPLRVPNETIGVYVADFSYRDRLGRTVVEDVKGFDVPLAKWKRRHYEAQYGIKIRLIR